jgi:ADP-heptose:LPS heptosyltransferase
LHPTFEKILTRAAQRRNAAPAPREKTSPPRRALIIRLNRLGDLVCTLPFYRTLAANWPGCRVDWLLSETNAVLAPHLCASGEVFVLPESRSRYWLPGDLLRRLQEQDYDVSFAVKAGYDSRLAWVSLAIGAAARVGFAEASDKLSFAYTKPLAPPPSAQHQVEKSLALLAPFNFSSTSNDISLNFSEAARAKIKRKLVELRLNRASPFALIQVSSTKRGFMRWPQEFYARLGGFFMDAGWLVCINALPQDRERADALAAKISAPVICCDSMDEYLALLAAARLVVGTDGGGIHLAASVGARTAAFFSESNPAKWRPWADGHIQFYTAGRAISEVTPEQVWLELRKHFSELK